MAGTSPTNMLSGILLFFGIELLALVIAIFGGSILDLLEGNFYALGFYSNLPAEWDTTAGEGMLVNIFYAVPYILAILGLFVLFVTIFHRVGRDREDEDEEYNEYNSDQL